MPNLERKQPRKNDKLAKLHTNAADLLKRISASRGNPSLRDCAMAGIYATQLEQRKTTD